jgi:hypothetical protein
MKAQFIDVLCTDGKRYRKRAVIVGERVAVSRRVNQSGKNLSGYVVSDPVTGGSYLRGWMAFETEALAVRWARRLVKEFGTNPIGDGELHKSGQKWNVQPPRVKDLAQFINALSREDFGTP